MSAYKTAASLKLRFTSNQGLLTVEDLFDLNLDNLNEIAKYVNRQLKEIQEESFIEIKSDKDTIIELKLNILKDIIATKLEQKKEKEQAHEIRQKKQQLLNLLEKKENEQLSLKSIEDIRAELKTLR